MSGRGIAAFGGIAGAAGVALLAVGAHHPAGANLTSAGQMLLFHAPFLFLLGLSGASARLAPFGRIALFVLVMGLVLFSLDLGLRGFFGFRLFPFAAPLGGSLMILGWLGLGITAWLARTR